MAVAENAAPLRKQWVYGAAALLSLLLSACGSSSDQGPPSSTVSFTLLHAFNTTDGGQVDALAAESNGDLVGGTVINAGTLFQLTPNGMLSTLHNFSGADGYGPSTLIFGTDGNLYGATSSGGANTDGTIFIITPNGTLSTLYSFSGSDGSSPTALVQGSDGLLYGTTARGGAEGYGTVFKLSLDGNLTMLYTFTGPDGDGPKILIQGSDGSFYGITSGGGSTFQNAVQFGAGTVFVITSAGTFTSLYSFTGPDGYQPTALVQGPNGNLYGTTYGNSNAGGNVFMLTLGGMLTSYTRSPVRTARCQRHCYWAVTATSTARRRRGGRRTSQTA